MFISSGQDCFSIRSSTGIIIIRYDTEKEKFSSFSDRSALYNSVDSAVGLVENEIKKIPKERAYFFNDFYSRFSSKGFTLPEMTLILEELGRIKAYGPSQREIRLFQEKHRE